MKIKKANGFLYFLYRIIFRPYLFFKYRLHFDRKTVKNLKKPYIIISNHVVALDAFVVGANVKHAVNFVASDAMFRKSFSGWAIRTFAQPIPISKGNADATTVKNIIGIIRKNGVVGIFPEGNTCFFGETGTFKPTIGKLAKKLNVPLVIVQIRGGYNTAPRWKSKKNNKGRMDAYAKRILTVEELDAMSDDEINKMISEELYFNEYEYNKEKQIKFKGRKKAEYLETALFACPECRSLKNMVSDKNDFYCSDCGARVRINDFGFFEKIHNAEKLPDTILEWSKVQLDIVKSLNFSEYKDKPIFSDNNIKLYKTGRGIRDELISQGEVEMYNDRIIAGGRAFRIEDIESMTMFKMRRLQIYNKDGSSYAIIVPQRVNIMKYMICYYEGKYKMNNEEGGYYGY